MLRAKKIGKFSRKDFCIYATTTVKKRAFLCDSFFKKHEPKCLPEVSLSIFKWVANCFCAQYFVLLETIFGAWEKHVQNFFMPESFNSFYQSFLSLLLT